MASKKQRSAKQRARKHHARAARDRADATAADGDAEDERVEGSHTADAAAPAPAAEQLALPLLDGEVSPVDAARDEDDGERADGPVDDDVVPAADEPAGDAPPVGATEAVPAPAALTPAAPSVEVRAPQPPEGDDEVAPVAAATAAAPADGLAEPPSTVEPPDDPDDDRVEEPTSPRPAAAERADAAPAAPPATETIGADALEEADGTSSTVSERATEEPLVSGAPPTRAEADDAGAPTLGPRDAADEVRRFALDLPSAEVVAPAEAIPAPRTPVADAVDEDEVARLRAEVARALGALTPDPAGEDSAPQEADPDVEPIEAVAPPAAAAAASTPASAPAGEELTEDAPPVEVAPAPAPAPPVELPEPAAEPSPGERGADREVRHLGQAAGPGEDTPLEELDHVADVSDLDADPDWVDAVAPRESPAAVAVKSLALIALAIVLIVGISLGAVLWLQDATAVRAP